MVTKKGKGSEIIELVGEKSYASTIVLEDTDPSSLSQTTNQHTVNLSQD